MTWDARIGAIGTVIATLLLILGAVRSMRKSAQDQRDKIDRQLADTKQSAYNDGNADARRELNARIDLLTSQRDDARRDRDLAVQEKSQYEADLRRVWSREPREDGHQ